MSVGDGIGGNNLFRFLKPKKQSCSWCGQVSQCVRWSELGSEQKVPCVMMHRRARKNDRLLYLTSVSFPKQHIPVVPLLEVSVRLGFALSFAWRQTIGSTFPGSSHNIFTRLQN